MRFAFIISAIFASLAFASSPSLFAREALPAAAPMDPALHSLIERSLQQRDELSDLATSFNNFVAQIGPTLEALATLLSAQTLNEIISIVNHASLVLNDQGTAEVNLILQQGARLLAPNNTDAIIAIIDDVGPLAEDLEPLLSKLDTVLGGLAGFLKIPGWR